MVAITVRQLEETAFDDARHELYDLYRREYASLVRLASILLDDRGACEEVVQDAFVKALVKWRTIRDPERAPAFLRSVVLNGARSQLRRRAVAHRRAQPAPDSVDSDEARAVESRRMVVALRRLPARQRECLVLRFYLDLSERQIAESLHLSPGAVKTHTHRGLANLARRLEEQQR